MITLSRTSNFTGKFNTMSLPISETTYDAAFKQWQSGSLIQNAFPMLNANQRESIMTGITPEEWDSHFEFIDDEEA